MTLIHNDEAGEAEHSRSELVEVLSHAGCRVAYFVAPTCDLAEVVELPADVIAVAGGDGTVSRVARCLRPNGCPLAVLPLGTANNIAKSLYVRNWHFAELATAWATAPVRPFYSIEAIGPWGRRRVIEGIGLGAFEQAIRDLQNKPTVDRARELLAKAVRTRAPEMIQIELEGETIARFLIMLEIATIPLMGPNLKLSESASPFDRHFDISLVGDGEGERHRLSTWLDTQCSGEAPVETRLADRAVITGQSRCVRLDGELWRGVPSAPRHGAITLRTEPEPLPFLVPV